MNIDSLLTTFKNELNEDYKTYDGVGTTYHLGNKQKVKESIDFSSLTDKQLNDKKEYYNEMIEKAKLYIDDINDILRKNKTSK